jgi:HK97 family phage major capsid protein
MDLTQLQETKERCKKLVVEAQGLVAAADTENRELTDKESVRMDLVQDEIDSITNAIKIAENENRRERLLKQEALMVQPAERKVPPGPYTDRIVMSDIKVYPKRRSTGPLRGFDSEHQAFAAGQWIKAQLGGDEKARQWCGWNLPETRVLVTTNNTSAGYLVPEQFESAIITNREDWGIARMNCTVVGMGSDRLTIPKWSSSPTATWVTEGGALTAADPTYSQVQLTASKLTRLTRVSSEMFQDSAIDLAAWLAMDIGRSFAEAEDDAWINGDGSATYGGILGIRTIFNTNQATYAGAVQATANTDTYSEVALADFDALMAVLPSYAIANAKFYISQYGFSRAMEAVAFAVGTNTHDLSSGFASQWMGYPVIKANKMVASNASQDNEAMILFGDMPAACLLGDRRAIRLATLTELYAATDEVGIMATERIDIACHGAGDATNAGPVVALIGAV